MASQVETTLILDAGGRRERPAQARSPSAAPVPARLGRYELVHELGKGAMGVVYRARDPRINREVALKAIPLADEFDAQEIEQARTRFFREAEMAGRLSHPHIVTIYDAGEDHGTAYIAMELLRGTPPRRVHERDPPAAARHRHRNRGAARRCAALCAPEPGRTPGHQAREYHVRAGERRTQDHGLRHRPPDGLGPHPHGRRARHPVVHVARAAAGAHRSPAAPTCFPWRSRCSSC